MPVLIDLLKDETPSIRQAVAYGLGQLGPEAAAAVPGLSDALRDDDDFVKVSAATALGNIGPEAKDAIPALTALATGDEATDDAAPAVRQAKRSAAVAALEAIKRTRSR